MGNPNTEEGKALLRERSPLYKAGKIVRPLLIGQGANDPRVNAGRVRPDRGGDDGNKGIPVTYVLFPDEGHGFARPENNIAFNAVTENFLAAASAVAPSRSAARSRPPRPRCPPGRRTRRGWRPPSSSA